MTDRAAVAGDRVLLHPSYFIICGRYRNVKWPTEPTALPQEFPMGDELLAEMEPSSDHPIWSLYEQGSPFVQNLGAVTTKYLDFKKVPGNCFQTSVWFGTSVLSQKRQRRAIDRSRGTAKGKGKAKGKDKGKGMGKAEGKGKGEGHLRS